MIHVIARIQIQPGRLNDFFQEFLKIVPDVLNEKGCLEYGPTRDVVSGLERQVPVRDDVATIIEKWEDLDALKAHLVAPHMLAYRERVKALVIKAELFITEPVTN